MSNKKKLIIIDGNSLIYRAFYAIPLLKTSTNFVTNAAYGFTNMMLKVLKDEKPDFVIVAFDKSRTTFRTEQYSEYKANRKPVPDDLKHQFQIVRDILAAMNIQIFELENYEADDLIGTIAKSVANDIFVLIITGDRDILQLVSENTNVLTTKKGISQLEIYDRDKVFEKFGVYPEQFVDFRAITGDTSDNIPGVPGIGAKTAAKLLQKYKNLDNILSHLNELPKKHKEKFLKYKDQLLLSKELASLKLDLPVNINLQDCACRNPDYERLFEIFNKLEFKSLINSLDLQNKLMNTAHNDEKKSKNITNSSYEKDIISLDASFELSELISSIKSSTKISLVLNGSKENGISSAAVGVDLFGSEKLFYLPMENKQHIEILKNICEDKDNKLICHNAKNMIWLLRHHSINLTSLSFDTMIAAYLLNPANNNLDLKDIALNYLSLNLSENKKDEKLLLEKARILLQLESILKKNLIDQQQENLFYQVELPLVSILADMEITGMRVDIEVLKSMSAELDKKINLLAQEIYELTGTTFNINSTKQLGEVLFEKLKFPVIKKTKTGYSTSASVLEELLSKLSDPKKIKIIEKLLEYRQLTKLKSTYTDGLANLVNPKTGCIHTTLNQTSTATGRLSSTDPNLQNIPIRLELGKQIRKAFIPRNANNIILTADYSQIELRILAHFSKDENLINAFKTGKDIHASTASEIFGVPISEVTPAMRRQAKAVNFGIIYGLSSYGLARDINITQEQAREYIKRYFERYPKVKEFIDTTVEKAKEQGYVTTILNRRRYLPELSSKNYNIRSFGERAAINTPIQGSAADIIKLAMVKISEEFNKNNMQSKMILQIHDELIFDVPKSEVNDVVQLVRHIMENAIKLDVPLVVDMKIGNNWYDLNPIS